MTHLGCSQRRIPVADESRWSPGVQPDLPRSPRGSMMLTQPAPDRVASMIGITRGPRHRLAPGARGWGLLRDLLQRSVDRVEAGWQVVGQGHRDHHVRT